MARKLRKTKPAERDLDSIWHYTEEVFDAEQADEYDRVLEQAMLDIQEDPLRPTSKSRPEYGPDVRSYRVDLSIKRSGARIRSARHIVFYSLESSAEVVVLRVLHEEQEADRQLGQMPPD